MNNLTSEPNEAQHSITNCACTAHPSRDKNIGLTLHFYFTSGSTLLWLACSPKAVAGEL